jgi:hypothetical protein
MSRLRTALSMLVAGVLILSGGRAPIARAQDAGLLAAWRDGEIRTSASQATGATDVFVALVPVCAQASPTLVFRATLRSRQQDSPPPDLEVRAAFGMRTDPNVVHAPSLAFIVQTPPMAPSTIAVGALRPALGPWAPGEAVDVMLGRLSTQDLAHIAVAKKVSVRVLGLDACALTDAEIAALREFADDIHLRR